MAAQDTKKRRGPEDGPKVHASEMGVWGSVVDRAAVQLNANRGEIASLKSELWHALITIQESSSMRTLEEKNEISNTEILVQRIADIKRYKTQEKPSWYVNQQS